MGRKSGCLSLAGFVVFLAIGAITVDAGIRPSFSLDGCSWSATHIVLVQTTPTDGAFSVVESWKGDLKPGDSLEVPELKPNKDAVPISSNQEPQGFGSEDAQRISEQIPRQPVGSRMILFLKKRYEGGTASPSAIHLILLKLQNQFAFRFFRNLGATWSNLEQPVIFHSRAPQHCPRAPVVCSRNASAVRRMRLPQKPSACIQGGFSTKGKRLNSGVVPVSVSI